MAGDGFRDNQGRFLPNHMNANDALQRDVGDRYQVSVDYMGKPEKAIAQIKEPNPHQYGPGVSSDIYPKNGNPPNLVTVNKKYKK
jgi:hypothetical protein